MSRNGGIKKTTDNDDDNVELILRAAEDEMILNLSIDSHMSRVSPSYIDPDLDRRLQALKSRPRPTPTKPTSNTVQERKPNPTPPLTIPTTKATHLEDVEEPKVDDLFARFAALKGSLPSYSSSSLLDDIKIDSNQNVNSDDLLHPSRSGIIGHGQQLSPRGGDDDIDEDEVQKLIKWAIDAARLEPSPPSDADDEDDKDDSVYSDDDNDDEPYQKKKGKQK